MDFMPLFFLFQAAEKIGIDEKFFKVLGLKNPLERQKFHQLSLYQRVWLVLTLCHWCVVRTDTLVFIVYL